MASQSGQGQVGGGYTVARGPGRILGSGATVIGPLPHDFLCHPVPTGHWRGQSNDRGRGAGHVLGPVNAASHAAITGSTHASPPPGPSRSQEGNRGRGRGRCRGNSSQGRGNYSNNQGRTLGTDLTDASPLPVIPQGQSANRGRGNGRGRGRYQQNRGGYSHRSANDFSNASPSSRTLPDQDYIQGRGTERGGVALPRTWGLKPRDQKTVNPTPWLKYEFENPGENLLMKLPGELRNRIYDMIFVKGDVRIGWFKRGYHLTYQLRHEDGKLSGPLKPESKLKTQPANKRFKPKQPKSKQPQQKHRTTRAERLSRPQGGGIAALMVCCKPIYHETAPLFYSNFTWAFTTLGAMRFFLNRMSYHAMTGIHTIAFSHATHGAPLLTNYQGFKDLHDAFFLNFCNRLAHVLTNLRSLSICMQINEQAPLELNLKASWVMPLLAFAHRNLERADVSFLSAGRYGHADQRLRAFAGVVKRELLGEWSKLRRDTSADEILDEMLGDSAPAGVAKDGKRMLMEGSDKKGKGVDRRGGRRSAKVRYDKRGYLIGDDKPQRLRRIMQTFDGEDDFVGDWQPPLMDVGAEYAFTA